MLKTRVVTALLLVAGLALILFALPPLAAVLAFAAIAALAAWEWGGLMRQDQPARVMYAFVLVLFCWQLTVAAAQLVPVLLGVAAVFWILVVPLWFRYRWRLAGNDFFGYLLGALVILPTWAAMVALHAVSTWLLLAAMALVWVADISAYFAGRAFGKHGRHKLAPTISPGKTWEGVAGAVVGVLIYGAIVLSYSPLAGSLPLAWPLLALLLILLTAASVIGDLFESLLKRQAGIKDSSNLLPGHGGVLDRIDALTSTLPLAALILYLVKS
ncbi:phosphatidate cytidylyltransferase [Sulfuritalea sp.]|uniref:phosphatidate cytidylyltransferase n=1 Tax=Sulfuritalea sp. TaxID=2480090 RepID=UPI00286E628E|nr:phosphatidate cytidylyltransferase [Sulfuritalea sp.]